MFNSQARYESQLAEMFEEDAEGTLSYLDKEYQRAMDSYPEGEEVIYCSICCQPLVYNSISYTEGCHVDSCV